MFSDDEINLVDRFLEDFFGALLLAAEYVGLGGSEELDNVRKSIIGLRELAEHIEKMVPTSSDPQMLDRFNLLFRELLTVFDSLDICRDVGHWESFLKRGYFEGNKDAWNNLNLYLAIRNPRLAYHSDLLFACINSVCSVYDASVDFGKKIDTVFTGYVKKDFDIARTRFIRLLRSA